MNRISIYLILIIIFLSSILYLGFLPTSDEGIHLYNSYRIYQGQIIYQDFDSYLMPLTYIIGAIIFGIFGESILSPRLLILGISLATILIYHKYLKRLEFEGYREALLLIYIICVFPVGYVYSHHNLDNFIFLFLITYIAGLNIKSIKDINYSQYLVLGTLICLISLIHQAHGFYYFIPFFLASFLDKKKISFFLIPFIIIYGFLLIWLVKIKSIYEFFDGILIWPLTIYKKYFGYGYFEEQIYNLLNPVDYILKIESFFMLFVKGSIFLYLICWVFFIYKKLSLKQNIIILLILLNFIGQSVNFNSMTAYYIFGLLSPFIFLQLNNLISNKKIVISLIIILLLIQFTRFISFPVRTYYSILNTVSCDVGIRKGYSNLNNASLILDIQDIYRYIMEEEIKISTVYGRSPYLYFYLPVENSSRYDVILPNYIPHEKFVRLHESLSGKYIIYDKSIENIKANIDFIDYANYKRLDTENFFNSKQMIEIKQKAVYENNHFIISKL